MVLDWHLVKLEDFLWNDIDNNDYKGFVGKSKSIYSFYYQRFRHSFITLVVIGVQTTTDRWLPSFFWWLLSNHVDFKNKNSIFLFWTSFSRCYKMFRIQSFLFFLWPVGINQNFIINDTDEFSSEFHHRKREYLKILQVNGIVVMDVTTVEIT